MKSLEEVLESVKEYIVEIKGKMPEDVMNISTDSRKISKSSVFFALPGTKDDGKRYINDAISNGAKIVFYEGELEDKLSENVLYIRVNDIFEVLGKFSAAFYNFPAHKLSIIGVTGTNGKTTTTNLLYHYWKCRGLKAGLIGTIDYRIDNEIYASNFTTPQPHELQELFKRMVDREVKYVAMEVSSHALALKRIEGVTLKGIVFTNLTQDHLDFHKTMEDYFQAKLKIFNYLDSDGFVILNKDNEWTRKVNLKNDKTFWVSLEEKSDVYLKNYKNTEDGVFLKVVTPLGELNIESKLKGRFNIYNILFAVGVLVALNEPLNEISKYLSLFNGVKGRLEFINLGQNFNVIVDYAHTPDGLYNVLQTVREFTRGRIIVVFGCGGDRDPTKRDKMGEISASLSDVVIITSDNPRTEDPLKIIKDIEKGVIRKNFKDYCIIEDREEAIKKAIEIAQDGDTVLIAGKGHEDYQIIGTRKIPFSDQEVARKYLMRRVLKNEA